MTERDQILSTGASAKPQRAEPTLRDLEMLLSAQADELVRVKHALVTIKEDAHMILEWVERIGQGNTGGYPHAGYSHTTNFPEQFLTAHGQPYHAWIPPGESQAARDKCPVCNPEWETCRFANHPHAGSCSAIAARDRTPQQSNPLSAATERLVQAAEAVSRHFPASYVAWEGLAELRNRIAAYRRAQKEAGDART